MNFPKTNNKVVKHSVGVKELNDVNKISSGLAAKEFLNKHALLEHYNDIDKQMEHSNKLHENKKSIGIVASKNLLESQIINKSNEIYNEGKNILFKEILFEMFKKSLILDNEFVIENYEILKGVIDNYIDKNGKFKFLENAVLLNKSPVLQKMLSLCESIASDVSKRKIKEAQEKQDVNIISFDINDDEKEKLNYEKDKLGIDELAKLVKQKVLTVVQDEKTRQTKESELMNDIENELSEDDSIKDEKSLEEALRKIAIKQNPIEETTLFNALLRHSYKEILETTIINQADEMVHDTQNKNKSFDVSVDKEDISNNEDFELTKKDIKKGEYNLIDEINDAEDNDESLISEEEFEIDMDLVLAEALTKYTLLELAHTIQLETYNSESVKRLAQKLIQ